MKGRYLRRVGGLVLSVFMLSAIVFLSSAETQAQNRRRIIVRPNPHRIYRPFGFRYRSWWDYPYGYNRWGYDPWSPYGSYYRQYVFSNSEKAVAQGYKDGFKTGKSDGKKAKSYDPERSHYYYDSGFGNYSDVYRSGFSKGYQDGYRVGGNERAG